MRIEDEYGRAWRVSAGDPANRYVLALKSRGLDIVCLSWYTIVTGELSTPDLTPEDVVMATRLTDCFTLLKGQFSSN